MMKKLSTLLMVLGLLAFGATNASATPVVFSSPLSGAAEAPPNASLGTGFAKVTFDIALHTMLVEVTFSGLTGTTTQAHVHCCTAVPFAGTVGVATELPLFTGFPTGVTSGTYSHLFDTSLAATWNAAFVTANGGIPGAEAAFLAGMFAGRAYLNVHSTFVPGGEIRGFVVTPEPATWTLLGLGLATLVVSRRRRK